MRGEPRHRAADHGRPRVTEAPIGLAGDTATGASKEVTLETGLKIHVPLFINEGDVLRIDTRDGKYLTRV